MPTRDVLDLFLIIVFGDFLDPFFFNNHAISHVFFTCQDQLVVQDYLWWWFDGK